MTDRTNFMLDSDESDPVVSTINVYNCSTAGSNSFLLQFPLVSRNSGIPLIQLVGHNDEKDNYTFTVDHPEILSTNPVTHNEETADIPISQPLAIGVLRGDELHLTPVYKVLQSRPLPVGKEPSASTMDMTWFPIQDFSEFVSSSHEDIQANMSSEMLTRMLTDSSTGTDFEYIRDIDQSDLGSRPPKEQLLVYLLQEKTIHFDEALDKLNLKAHTEELLEVILENAYFIQGRWTLKPEKIPEKNLPQELRIARNFVIVLFANKKTLSDKLTKVFIKLFNLEKSSLPKILERLGVKMKEGQNICFRFKENPIFEQRHQEYVSRAKKEIQSLKESICVARRDPHIFDPFLQ